MTVKERVKQRVIREFFNSHSYKKKDAIDEVITAYPYEFSPVWRNKFLDAVRLNFLHHKTHSDFYRRLCEYKKFDESQISSFDDIWDIPYILSDTFKFYNIETKTRDPLKTEFTSSGTSGRKSKISMNIISGLRLLSSIYLVYKTLGLASEEPANYLMMCYNPEADNNVGTTNSDVVISCLTPRNELFYVLDINKAGHMEFLKDRSVEKLREFINEGRPIRILGFVHHTCEVIISYREKYGRVQFPENSCILTGGGWKGARNPYGEDFDYFAFLEENTTIDLKNVRDLYTLIEHPVFYLECEEHHKHIPNVSLACARDPRTLKKLPYGKTGLIHLITPLVESCPILSILTTDYGCIEKSCSCSIGGPYIKIIGRAGMTKKVTCAFTADQFVSGNGTEAVRK